MDSGAAIWTQQKSHHGWQVLPALRREGGGEALSTTFPPPRLDPGMMDIKPYYPTLTLSATKELFLKMKCFLSILWGHIWMLLMDLVTWHCASKINVASVSASLSCFSVWKNQNSSIKRQKNFLQGLSPTYFFNAVQSTPKQTAHLIPLGVDFQVLEISRLHHRVFHCTIHLCTNIPHLVLASLPIL